MHSANVVRFVLVCHGCMSILTHHHTNSGSVFKFDVCHNLGRWSPTSIFLWFQIKIDTIAENKERRVQKCSPYSIYISFSTLVDIFLTWLSPGFSFMLGGSRMKVAAVLSCWKQKLTSASNGEVLQTTIFSMFSGYLPSLYRSRVLPIKKINFHKT